MSDTRLPAYLTLADLTAHGISREDIRRRCPLAVEYGPAAAPYWLAEDLAGLLEPDNGEDPTP